MDELNEEIARTLDKVETELRPLLSAVEACRTTAVAALVIASFALLVAMWN